MKSLIALLIACALASSTYAQRPPIIDADAKHAANAPTVETQAPADAEADAPDKIIARFFSYLQRAEVDQAYDQLTRGTKIAERAEDVKTLKSKTREAIRVLGPIQGYDFVAKKSVGARLSSYTLVSLGKDYPLRWRFYFYKAQDTWKLIDIRVDERLGVIFDEPEESQPREKP